MPGRLPPCRSHCGSLGMFEMRGLLDLSARSLEDTLGLLRVLAGERLFQVGLEQAESELLELASGLRGLRRKRRGRPRGPSTPDADAELLAIYDRRVAAACEAGDKLSLSDVAEEAVRDMPAFQVPSNDKKVIKAKIAAVQRRLYMLLERRAVEGLAEVAARFGIYAEKIGLLQYPRPYTADEILPFWRSRKRSGKLGDIFEALRRHAAGDGGSDVCGSPDTPTSTAGQGLAAYEK